MSVRKKSVFIEPVKYYLNYASCVADEVRAEIGNKLEITPIPGDSANPSTILRILETEDPIHVWGVGHGAACIYSVEYKKLFLVNMSGAHVKCIRDMNLDSMNGRVVHLLSCKTGVELGYKLVEHGALTYFGYEDSFWFWIGSDPCSDRAAKSTHRCDLEVEIQLANGKTTGEARDATLAKFDDEIAYWEESRHPHADVLVRILEMDKSVFRMYGNPNIRIIGAPGPRIPRPEFARLAPTLSLFKVNELYKRNLITSGVAIRMIYLVTLEKTPSGGEIDKYKDLLKTKGVYEVAKRLM